MLITTFILAYIYEIIDAITYCLTFLSANVDNTANIY